MKSKSARITVKVTYVYSAEWKDYNFSYYGTTHYTHIFKGEDGKTYVWKTTNPMEYVDEDGYGASLWLKSEIELTGTVKEVNEYKGEPQTVLTRCKFKIIRLGKSPTEIANEQWERKQQRKKEQLAGIGENDFIWKMPYRQYKEHYSDCETVIDSYDSCEDSKGIRHGQPTIDVIIREGRLKASGVRGKHYHTFFFVEKLTGAELSFYAISEETATKQLVKAGYDPNDFEKCYAVNY